MDMFMCVLAFELCASLSIGCNFFRWFFFLFISFDFPLFRLNSKRRFFGFGSWENDLFRYAKSVFFDGNAIQNVHNFFLRDGVGSMSLFFVCFRARSHSLLLSLSLSQKPSLLGLIRRLYDFTACVRLQSNRFWQCVVVQKLFRFM